MPKWIYCRFPALADGQPGDPTGREIGETLSPRYPAEVLEAVREEDEAFFAGHYQGDPVAATGMYFKEEDFQNRVSLANLPPVRRWVMGWDLASKTKDQNDYTAGALIGLTFDGRIVIKDVVRWKMEYPDARDTIIETSRFYGTEVVIAIEDKSAGTQLLQELSRDPQMAGFAIYPVQASVDKKLRANVWASRARQGKLVLAEGRWVEPFVAECLAFDGNGLVHDDQVDAVSVAWSVLYLDLDQKEKDVDQSTIPGTMQFYERLARAQAPQDEDEW